MEILAHNLLGSEAWRELGIGGECTYLSEEYEVHEIKTTYLKTLKLNQNTLMEEKDVWFYLPLHKLFLMA